MPGCLWRVTGFVLKSESILNMKKFIVLLLVCICAVNIKISSQWINITPGGSDTAVFVVYTLNANVAFISRGNLGTVLRTTNGGLNWISIPNPSTQSINKIQFLNENTGFLGGNNALFKTTNGGNSWLTLFNTDGFSDIHFINESTGYLLSINSPPKIYRTTNGGLNFFSRSLLSYVNYSGVSLSVSGTNNIFILTSFPASDSSIVFKNTNWDSSFISVYSAKSIFYDMSFLNSGTGIICGNAGALRRTSDGGLNWINVNPGNSITFQAAQLLNPNTAYITGNAGSIFKSTNGGINWQQQSSQTNWYLNDISVLSNDSTGFAVGEFGTILKTSNGGITFTGTQSNNIPNGYKLFQNYPNPFNPSTVFRFNMPAAGNVTLKIYDITGKLVKELLNSSFPSGKHEVLFNSGELSSGAYFYKLQTKGFSDIKKMVLIK